MRPLVLLFVAMACGAPMVAHADEPAAAAPSGPVQLKVSPASLIYAKVYKQGAAAAVAHDHVVQAKNPSGSGVWHPTDASQCKVTVTVKVADLFPDAESLRKAVGLPVPGPSADQQQEILEHMLADYQLNVAKYTTITFTSTSMSGTTGAVTVVGNLTLHGVTKQITVPMTLTPNADGSLRAKGKYQIVQSNFGYAPYSALFGALAVKDAVDVGLDITLTP